MNRSCNLLRTSLISHVPRRNKAFQGELKGTMNDLLQPHGCWKTHYDAKQRKYNAHLVMGLAAFTGTLLIGKTAGFFYFNATVPSEPAAKNDYSK